MQEENTALKAEFGRLFAKADNVFMMFLVLDAALPLFVYFFPSGKSENINSLPRNYFVVFLVFTTVAFFIARRFASPFNITETLVNKVKYYFRRIRITQLSLFSIQVLTAALCYFYPGWEFSVIMIFVLLLHVLYRSTPKGFIKAANLSSGEKALIPDDLY